jgi:Mlc titration factor MtfA (ptsG expression regulator)
MRREPIDGEEALEWHQAATAPFPEAWRQILRERVPYYGILKDEERERLEAKIKVFALTKTFSSADDLTITEEMKVVVAAAACRLTMNMPWEHYAQVQHVALREKEFTTRDGVHAIGTGGRWKVTLAWPEVLHGLAVPDDGDNVGYHEFAHALDGADDTMDGEAPGPRSDLYPTWAQVIASGRAEVQSALDEDRAPPIDGYAATNDSEFFAVATEWLFERPRSLRETLPAVYELLSRFYHQDLADDDRFCESERDIEVRRGRGTEPRGARPDEESEEISSLIRIRAEQVAAGIGRSRFPGRTRTPVRVDHKDPDGWGARNVLRLIAWVSFLFAAFFLFPCSGAGSGRSHAPGAETLTLLSYTHGVRLAGLILAGVSLVAFVAVLFVRDRGED